MKTWKTTKYKMSNNHKTKTYRENKKGYDFILGNFPPDTKELRGSVYRIQQ